MMLTDHVTAPYIIGPYGNRLRKEDLPLSSERRWSVRKKAEVLAAIRGGLLSEEDALQRYRLSIEELGRWFYLVERHGLNGLRTTRSQQYKLYSKAR